ncbi:MAG: outer rane secretin family protein, partial [Myxococcaceae bacterium]|nr:outer rane secretin family protein [Myxococcaceae bacterium]
MRVSGLSCLAAVFALLTSAVALGQEGGNISLGVGTQKVITVPGIQRVAVGDSAIADVKTIGNNQLLVIGAGE